MALSLTLTELVMLIAAAIGAVTAFWIQISAIKRNAVTRSELAAAMTELASAIKEDRTELRVEMNKLNERMDRFRHREAAHIMWFGVIFTKLALPLPPEHLDSVP